MVPCMATKTISLEIDAYDKLRKARRRDRESFSSVVRRASFNAPPHTGGAVLECVRNLPGDAVVSEATIKYWEESRREDRLAPLISPSAWERSDAS